MGGGSSWLRGRQRMDHAHVVRPMGQRTDGAFVRTPDGSLIDITPVEKDAPRGGLFVAHEGDDALFLAMKALGIEMQCLKSHVDPAEIDSFLSMIQPHDEEV